MVVLVCPYFIVMLVTNKRFISRKREMGIFSRLIQYRGSKRNSGSLLRATLTLRPSKGSSGFTPHFVVTRSGAKPDSEAQVASFSWVGTTINLGAYHF